MRLGRRVFSSLTVRCLLVAGLYAGFVALSIWTCANVADAHLNNAFPSALSVLGERREEVFNGSYDALADRNLGDSEALVLDGDGVVLFSTSTSFSQAVGVDDLEFINEHDLESRFYVLQEGTDEEPYYRVLRLTIDERTGFDNVEGYALLDGDLNIVDGTLFTGRDSITPEQFGLLNGVIEIPGARRAAEAAGETQAAAADGAVDGAQDVAAASAKAEDGYPFTNILQKGQYIITRTQGESDAGALRILVVADPVIDGDAYERVVEESRDIWLVLIPVLGVATIALFVAEMRLIRASTVPLASAFAGYAARGSAGVKPLHVASELQPAYDGFVELARRLERAQSDKQRMITDISHDIKTPLTVIRGYAQAFRDGMVPPQSVATYAQALCDKAEIATRMVETLGAYAAMEHPEYQVSREVCDLAATLELICDGLEPVAAQRGCELVCTIGDGPLPVQLDVELMRRALTNLVSNACLHNGPGTTVSVSCGRAELHGDARVARVLVADDGNGIDPELAARVFDPFVTSNVARQVGKGTGLGLAIVRRCVELNGGAIELMTEPPAPWSTCFSITLPLE